MLATPWQLYFCVTDFTKGLLLLTEARDDHEEAASMLLTSPLIVPCACIAFPLAFPHPNPSTDMSRPNILHTARQERRNKGDNGSGKQEEGDAWLVLDAC